MVIESWKPEDTFLLGKKLGEQAAASSVYCLNGDLGVGKTVFTQGFASGLGIKEAVNSPTFTIVQQYDDGRLPFYHFDVYRIGDVSEMDEIGYEDCFYGDGVSLIEWSELIEEILPETIISITIEKDLEKGFDYRKITVEGM
ncbi:MULTISPECIES: tRNA (adenosine(37)-N6)-threonylcarbamoyltransferase complex ATPase subunit type 1 TsaE [Clostridia]|jgi:tRNA threonylcarbamoyladenosine biosynthesis protein TsaE|uniref:tRNA threonylcarbamoyladenosine biosynthesis protein TsaE n=1 Tax=Lacrimispora xylanolytica TaxID=29375 RepID=A0ABY7AD19_9FIRM|nr:MULTISPECIES: tRNA (adenosine(37)-N6)-threonylcarbamoyltransferase complex ATPase subunit type 1 TsaE [Clostridia]MBS5958975.1 tRNA (adenosine(37)-N6)-threonylcarbamoyltransferase complex ATPase subunit type 1 TsaE [Clostridiales bacterium]WAJ24590.1 tRNA (adenosine(37)-N6)-threonylcarbamoyltransferase complex ATPase subunit type 1 TsaE [Lacrimispora xylanolytica]